MLCVSSAFQTLKNNKTTRPAASWFQLFSRVWKPDETIALVFETVYQGSRAEDQELRNEEFWNIHKFESCTSTSLTFTLR